MCSVDRFLPSVLAVRLPAWVAGIYCTRQQITRGRMTTPVILDESTSFVFPLTFEERTNRVRLLQHQWLVHCCAHAPPGGLGPHTRLRVPPLLFNVPEEYWQSTLRFQCYFGDCMFFFLYIWNVRNSRLDNNNDSCCAGCLHLISCGSGVLLLREEPAPACLWLWGPTVSSQAEPYICYDIYHISTKIVCGAYVFLTFSYLSLTNGIWLKVRW